MHRFISGLWVLFHWSVYLFSCQYHTVLITIALYFEVRKYDASSFVLAQDCFDYLESFVFPYEFLDCFFYFCEKCHQNFDREYIEYLTLDSMNIVVLVLPIHEHGMCFHLFIFSFHYF
jgi:hypothetical protein